MKINFIFLILVCFFVTSAQISSQEYSTDPYTVSLWHFNETEGGLAYDFSGNGINAWVGSMDVVEGKFGLARQNPIGGGSWIWPENLFVPEYEFGDGPFTIEAWIKTEGTTYIAYRPSDRAYELGIWGGENDYGTPYFFINCQVEAVFVWADMTDLNVLDNNWHHIAGVRDGESIKIFVDGKLRGIQNCSYAGAVLYEESQVNFNYPESHAILDEIRISNKARSAEEFNVQKIVLIDVKPSSFPNKINPKSNGVISVAILTTDTFDALTVDPLSVRFGLGNASESHNKGHLEDVDNDGDIDLVLHFGTQESGIQCGDTEVSLTGLTYSGESVIGMDFIETVGCGSNKEQIPEITAEIPNTYLLYQNYPNPFNPTTSIKYSLPKEDKVLIKVYDILGGEIVTLVNEEKFAGTYEVEFNASKLGSGIYIYTIRTKDYYDVKEMLYLK